MIMGVSGYPSRFVNLPAARSRFGERIDRLGQFLSRVDPRADAVVDAIEALPRGEGWRLFERGLARGARTIPDAPLAIRELLEEAEYVPLWVDWDACDRGGELLLRAGMIGGAVLGSRSLILGYASPAGNKPLVMSGRLKEQATRRVNETARFVQAVCRPRGMRPFADGWQITLKVRLIHAQVRRMILKSKRWNADAWGAPINQHDMAGTTLLFSVAMLDGLRKLGMRVEHEEAEHYMHLWRWGGRLIGVDDEILPTCEPDATRLASMMEATTADPDQDSRDLTRALFESAYDKVVTPKEKRDADRKVAFGLAISRELLGNEMSDKLGIGRTSFQYAIPAMKRLVAGVERFKRVVPFADRTAIAAGANYWDRVVEIGLAGATYEFALPERLGAHAA
ncbi:hypothetical protein AKJ09_01820 [Labilithrix luteola]|uniref:ER-bound oxygenase mpaB/mpaB'/Rubber oxygenase catalytic domain-containing protein n=1 Tax=Labilithrix luteola TaxID=1391654 RepID=A0A0K1PP18_9BACT|nr:oxygenase MpaB family protein [Labilithrix luteola]AKU95156.1 hypothetical protein AKJ09_01820 [Labilithrix luteola]